MSQKSSLPQASKSVSRVLMSDSPPDSDAPDRKQWLCSALT
jgi:hypothetical protein